MLAGAGGLRGGIGPLAWNDAPAKRVAALVTQQDDADHDRLDPIEDARYRGELAKTDI